MPEENKTDIANRKAQRNIILIASVAAGAFATGATYQILVNYFDPQGAMAKMFLSTAVFAVINGPIFLWLRRKP